MAAPAPLYVRCAHNPDHIYPSYLAECDVCALMRASSGWAGQSSVGLSSTTHLDPAQLAHLRMASGAQAPGSPSGTHNPDMDHGSEIPWGQYLGGAGWALAVFLLLFFVYQNFNRSSTPTPAAVAPTIQSPVERYAPEVPPTRPSEPYTPPPSGGYDASGPRSVYTPTPGGPVIAQPQTPTTVFRAQSDNLNERYYSLDDLIGSWKILDADHKEELGTLTVKNSGKLLNVEIPLWHNATAPMDIQHVEYDGNAWVLSTPQASKSAARFDLTFESKNEFTGIGSTVEHKQFHVKFTKA